MEYLFSCSLSLSLSVCLSQTWKCDRCRVNHHHHNLTESDLGLEMSLAHNVELLEIGFNTLQIGIKFKGDEGLRCLRCLRSGCWQKVIVELDTLPFVC